MKAFMRSAVCLALVSLLLTGCWDKYELTDWGFVQAVALDLADNGQIEMMVQIYRPGAASNPDTLQGSKSASYLTLSAQAETYTEASMAIAGKLGRELQWSHMRAVIIGEQMAQERDIGELLDFLSRSQGPRSSVSVLVTNGKATRYALIKPLIENTIGEQFKTAESIASRQSGIVQAITLMDLSILARVPNSLALLPHFTMDQKAGNVVEIDGIAVLRFPQGKTGEQLVPLDRAPYLMMLRGELRRGLITLACQSAGEGTPTAAETYRIIDADSKLRVYARNGKPLVRIQLKLDGKLEEMSCSNVQTPEGTHAFLKRLQEQVKRNAEEAAAYVQERREDLLLAGQYVQRHHPRLWKKWSNNWDDLFSEADIAVTVQVELTDTGMNEGVPLKAPPTAENSE